MDDRFFLTFLIVVFDGGEFIYLKVYSHYMER